MKHVEYFDATYQVPVKTILLLAKRKPLFGHTTMRHAKGGKACATHWFTFIKDE